MHGIEILQQLAIALHKDDNILNKRSDVLSKYRHRNKYVPANYDSKDKITSQSM